MKHQAPIRERCRCGSVRWTRMARGPPRGTSLGPSTCTDVEGPATGEAPQATSAGVASRLLIVHPSPGVIFDTSTLAWLLARRPKHLHGQPHDRFGHAVLRR